MIFDSYKMKIIDNKSFSIDGSTVYKDPRGTQNYTRKLATVKYRPIKLKSTMPKDTSDGKEAIDFENMGSDIESLHKEAFSKYKKIPFNIPIVIEPYFGYEEGYKDGNEKIKIEYYIYITTDNELTCLKIITTSRYDESKDTFWEKNKRYKVMKWEDAENELERYGINLAASKANSTHQMDKLLDTRKYRGIRGVLTRLSNWIENSRQGKTDKVEEK